MFSVRTSAAVVFGIGASAFCGAGCGGSGGGGGGGALPPQTLAWTDTNTVMRAIPTSNSAGGYALIANGGQAPFQAQLVSGALPQSWTFTSEANFSRISLNTAPTMNGTYTQVFRMSDSLGTTVDKQFTIQVADAIQVPSAPVGIAGQPYSHQLTATGGIPPYTRWQVVVGQGTGLPQGLTLNESTGVISGTPTTGGGAQSTFVIGVSDSGLHATNSTYDGAVQLTIRIN